MGTAPVPSTIHQTNFMLRHIQRRLLPFAAACLYTFSAQAQTDIDAIMMNKNQFCAGFQYNHSSWDQYWEGTLKRENLNIGTVTTQSVAVMGNYGITKKLNLLFGLPYVFTKASAGTMAGQQGIQDGMLGAKWKAVSHQSGKNKYALFAIGGVSAPLSQYTPDFLPLSIGLHSKQAFLRGMADYQRGKFFTTASATYLLRSNVDIARTAYYTTRMHYSNEVEMPNAWTANLRAGYRTSHLIIEAVADQMNTIGGFDIRRNDMPFISNRMNATNLGLNIRYEPRWLKQVSLTAGSMRTIAGRNMGQATSIYGGVFYIFQFGKKATTTQTR